MALEIWKEWQRKKGNILAVGFGKVALKIWGDVSVTKTEALDLEAEWQRQTQNLAELFAKKLGKTRQEYIESLPRFFPQPEAYKGRFHIPVIVETRLPLGKMAEILGIVQYYDANKTKDWEGSEFRTPEVPYTTWLHDGTPNLEKPVELVGTELKGDERGGTIYDGFGLFAKNTSVLNSHYLDFPGSRVGPVSAPGLGLLVGGPGLRHRFVGYPDQDVGSVVAGVEIRT